MGIYTNSWVMLKAQLISYSSASRYCRYCAAINLLQSLRKLLWERGRAYCGARMRAACCGVTTMVIKLGYVPPSTLVKGC